MARLSAYGWKLFAAALVAALALYPANARAELDTAIGPRTVVQNAPLADCDTNAKMALDTVLQNAFEDGTTNQWLAYGLYDANGHPSGAAAIHCYPVGNGYVVTFTCAVQVPPSPLLAAALCAKIDAAFAPRATATAAPSGK
jgi:hypothetical protein